MTGGSDDAGAQPLPAGWTREFQGRHGAEFFHEAEAVAVQVLPRYDPPGRRASESRPDHYLVRLQRPYSDRPGGPVEVVSAADIESALEAARTFMSEFGAGGPDRGARRAAVEAVAAVAGYSDDRLLALLSDRLGEGIRAVAHADPDGLAPVFGVDDPGDPVGGIPVADLCDRLRTAAGAAGGDGGPPGVAAALGGTTALWIPAGGDCGTLVAVDPDTAVAVPDLLEECATLLAGRRDG